MPRKILLPFILILLTVFTLSCIKYDSDDDGLYTAQTQDSVTLKLKRYRPSAYVPFNTGQPVLLFTGFAENFSEFIPHTSEKNRERYSDMTLDEPIATWAVGDTYIQEDPMLYYSMAHYLWNRGYDPWLANYRGAGRGEFKSGKRNNYATLDIYSTMDVPACVDLVISETGKPPVIGGHSTGGLVCYSYLQGVYFDMEELEDGYSNGYLPHIKSDPVLAAERNAKVKGFLGIDPAAIFPLPDFIDQPALWSLMSVNMYLNLDSIIENFVNPFIMDNFGDFFLTSLDMTLQLIIRIDEKTGQYISIFENMYAWNTQNTNSYVEDFFWRNCLSGTFVRAASQYYDWTVNDTMREHWKNGKENSSLSKGPEADPDNDGYYYYNQNMFFMTVPAISVLSEYDSLVEEDQIIKDVMEAKTAHELDEWHVIPNAGHNDVVFGSNSPDITFPLIGDWLEKLN